MSTPSASPDETTPYVPDTWGEGNGNPAAELRATRLQHIENGLSVADARARTALTRAGAGLTRLDAVEDELAGIAGRVHSQATPAASWVIPHSLGRLPAVTLYVAGEVVDADVTSTTTTTSVTLPSPTAGYAILT